MSKTNKNLEEKSEILNDPRFSHLVSDPRFKQLPKNEKKVKIDKRFKSMFDDKKFKVKYTVDKYGRKLNTTSSEDLKKYYDIESSDEDDEEEQRKLEEKQITKDTSDEEIGNDELETDGVTLSSDIKQKIKSSDIDYARGEGRLLSDSSSDEESAEEEDDEEFIEHVWGELDNDAPLTEESTRRLASCNMDWDRIRASDIMVLCHSFLPPGGSIISVKIYPSEFGKQRLAEEEINGPPELTESKKLSESDSDDDLIKEQDSDAEEGDDYHMEKLRQYQLNRLKYYYAVIECDSVPTADKLYKECDGLEYEKTATKLDFRFIPDDTSFDEDVPKDVCTELPDMNKYKPRLFTTTALQQAKVELTWDETSVERKELSEKLTSGSLAEVTEADLRKYVAYSSEEEESSSDEQEKETELEENGKEEKSSKDSICQYKSLLEEIKKKEDASKKSKFEMEYTWGINVSSSKEAVANIEKKTLTPIEKALEKKKEKNRKRKEERKKRSKNGEENEYNSDDDLPDGIDMNDPYFAEEFKNGDFEPLKKSKNKQSKKNHGNKNPDDYAADDKNAKELELLIDDGDDDKQHFSLTKIQQSENQKKSKKSKKKLGKLNELMKSKDEDNFEVKLNDDRFGALYTSHLFNIDPTDPRFKKTKGMEAIIHEKIKRRHSRPEQIDQGDPETKRPKKKVENSILVKNIKRKIQGRHF